jgi:NAD(P)-dependent dehydrogenase (short-subunit alcohol dehydrogenase family)
VLDLSRNRVLTVALEVTDDASRKAAIEDAAIEDMHLVFETNYFGSVSMIQYALPYLR